ncbi:MAG: protein translocase subunit SecD [Acidimicrobiia bacterium]
MRRNVIFLVSSIVIVIGALIATLVSGNTPVLGLDLRGGVSVVLSPVGNYKPEALDVAVDVIRNRVDSLGVAEPEISRQGSDIVVDLPGVKDRCKAERIVGQTAELRFRPVFIPGVPPAKAPTTTTTTAAPGASTTTSPSTTTTTTTLPTTTTTTPAQNTAANNECETTVAGNTAKSSKDEAANAAVASCDASAVAALPKIPTTSRENDKRKACVVLPDKPGGPRASRLYLGPAALTGKAVDSAKAEFRSSEGWTVTMDLTGSGSSKWDQLAQAQFHKQVAITLDSIVQSAPNIQPNDASFTSFNGTAVISGTFTESEAKDLAKLINYGALPVQLKKISVENVSPSLGQDQLDAGIAAGLLGLALVAAYMLFYYRLLGLVVIAGLGLSGIALYCVITYLGSSLGLALTLAGVTGIIVSVGITVDSYIVYYERLKDEVRAGSTVRACVDRAFTRSFRTIVAADLVSLIGAGVLYWLAIGSVRGFALMLGLSTILDLLVAYFFMHPLVSLMARNPELVRMRGVGIAAGLDAPGITA